MIGRRTMGCGLESRGRRRAEVHEGDYRVRGISARRIQAGAALLLGLLAAGLLASCARLDAVPVVDEVRVGEYGIVDQALAARAAYAVILGEVRRRHPDGLAVSQSTQASVRDFANRLSNRRSWSLSVHPNGRFRLYDRVLFGRISPGAPPRMEGGVGSWRASNGAIVLEIDWRSPKTNLRMLFGLSRDAEGEWDIIVQPPVLVGVVSGRSLNFASCEPVSFNQKWCSKLRDSGVALPQEIIVPMYWRYRWKGPPSSSAD